MTSPREWAEKICSLWHSDLWDETAKPGFPVVKKELESLLQQMVEEAVKDEQIKTQIQHNFYMVAIEQRDQARAQALDEAAKVVECLMPMPQGHVDCVIDTGKNIANAIRGLKDKGKEK